MDTPQKTEAGSKDINVDIHIGNEELTRNDTHWIPCVLNNKYTLHTALWLLIQNKEVQLGDNAHFYSRVSLDRLLLENSGQPSLGFSETIAKVPKSSGCLQIYTLLDRPHRMILNDPPIYRSFGNAWTSKGNITVLKDMSGTLHTEGSLQQEIPSTMWLSLQQVGAPEVSYMADWKSILSKAFPMSDFDLIIESATEAQYQAWKIKALTMPDFIPPASLAMHRPVNNSGRVKAMAAAIDERADSLRKPVMPGQWRTERKPSVIEGVKKDGIDAKAKTSPSSWWSRKR
ncbi:hypothetical protein HWV62_21990 [Athelia sp. TMB]|nr:hypothetical protein HWV62_21990 [Athelia sp. TMB]